MASVIVEIIFEDGKCMDRIYKSDANNPEEDALMRAQGTERHRLGSV